MKRVKLMFAAILVMAVVGGALAFKVKSDEVCVYSTELTPNPTCPQSTTCPQAVPVKDNLDVIQIANPCKYATTTTIPLDNICPSNRGCVQSRTLDDLD